MRRRSPSRALAVLGILTAAILLSGCSADEPIPSQAPSGDVPTPDASNSAAASPSPSESPEPTASEIVISGEGFDIIGLDGSVEFTHEWNDEVAPAVEALSEGLALEPLVVELPGDGARYAPTRNYIWDDALTFADAIDLDTPREDYFQPSSFFVEATEINGVEIRTASGIKVGDALSAVTAAGATAFPDGASYMTDAVDPSAIGSDDTSTRVVKIIVANDLVTGLLSPDESIQF